jgi:DTW domain-containing protein YfiP
MRCDGCRLSEDLCYCRDLTAVETRTRVVVLMHVSEIPVASNTGRLAERVLVRGETRVRGRRDKPMTMEGVVTGDRYPLVLFPSDDAVPIEEVETELPVTLIVPDGGWRQADKLQRRVRELDGVTRVGITPRGPSRYFLRKSPRPNGLCTFEAIIEAIGVLEGEALRDTLDAQFSEMVKRVLLSRGLYSLKVFREEGRYEPTHAYARPMPED